MRAFLASLLPRAIFAIEQNGSGFYGLDAVKRGAIGRQVKRDRRSLVERWRALGANESAGWEARARIAANMLSDVDAVADLGCGMMHLEKHLPKSVGYFPVDIVSRDSRTLVCDFNEEPPPSLAPAAACLGLIEYLFDVPTFLRQLHESYRVVVLTYNPVDRHGRKFDRAAHAWVNRYSIAQLERLFAESGWTWVAKAEVGARQFIWRLEPTTLAA